MKPFEGTDINRAETLSVLFKSLKHLVVLCSATSVQQVKLLFIDSCVLFTQLEMMFGKIVETLSGGALLDEAHQSGTGFEVL